MNEEQTRAFWKEYLQVEKTFYEEFLARQNLVSEGSVEELAKEYNIEITTFAGILDGINDSLITPLELEELEEDTPIRLEADKEKLYYNMLDAKAKWLYKLPQWDAHLDKKERLDIRSRYSEKNTLTVEKEPGRNEPCPCGSGKKYKKCCMNKKS